MDFSDRIFGRTYGIEIECVAPVGANQAQVAREITALGVPMIWAGGYSHARTNEWKITTDSTITSNTGLPFERGWEFVTPANPQHALRGEAGFLQIAKVCTYLQSKGFQVNRNCGLHVHVDVTRPRALSIPAMQRLAMLYAESETIIDTMVAPSRRGNLNHWCASIANRVTVRALETAQDINGLADIISFGRVRPTTQRRFGMGGHGRDSRRFVKLNVTSHWLYGTTEFRQFGGTIESGKISHWIMFCLRMVDRAEHSSTSNVAGPVARTLAMARRGTKRALVIDLMLRDEGTVQAEALAVSGWRAINLVRMAKEYGLHLRTETTRVNGKRVTRYFARHMTDEERVAQAASPAVAASSRARNLEELVTQLGMTDAEKEFWRQRVASLAGATVTPTR